MTLLAAYLFMTGFGQIYRACAAQIPTVAGRDGLSSDTGTFESPSIQVRPKFRYWLPDASVDPDSVAADVESIGSIGAGGIEFLPYYNYGGSIGSLNVSLTVSNWSVYGYGTPAYNTVLKAALQSTKDNNLLMDLCMGPQSGQGVPASPDNPGLAYDLVYNYTIVPAESFSAVVPGYEQGTLVSVTTAEILNLSVSEIPSSELIAAYNQTSFTISAGSLQDVTKSVQSNGKLSVSFPISTAGKNHIVFSAYYQRSLTRACIAGSANPQNIIQNGSFAVDHFSANGAKVTTDFLENYVMVNGVRDLFQQVGKYIWEDSVEIDSPLYWTPELQQNFQIMHNYDIGKFAMILHSGTNGLQFGVAYPIIITSDDPDQDRGVIDDYRDTLTIGLQSYYQALSNWSRAYLGTEFSGQTGYNLPVDAAQIIPVVGAPEDESLSFDTGTLSYYRQFVGPANLAGKRVISNEMGAISLKAYQFTLPQLLNLVKRAWSVGNNQMVYHGATFSGQYPNTTWPGVAAFSYLFSEAWSRHQPVWDHGFLEMNNFVSRTQWVLQSGIPQRDIVFWNKVTTGNILVWPMETFSDLEAAGYTYEFVSPENFELPLATVRDGILAPDGPSYKVLVIQANDTLTLKGTQKLVEYATQGLPIVFQGGLPTQINSINGLAQAQANIRSILSFENVYQVPGSLAPALASIGIQPRAKISATANWQTYWRKDNSTSTDYILIFNNDAVWSNGTISFATSKQPFLFNAWTGTQTPIVQYQYSSGYTTIPFSLAGGQTKIVAFKTLESSSSPSTYIMSAPTSVLGYTWSSNSGIAAKMPSSTSVGSFTLSNGKSVSISLQTTGPVIIFSNWTLIAESWTSGADFYNSSTIGIKTNKTFQLPELVSWAQITGLENASGVGYYRTFFSWSKSSGDGAIINFGAPINTLRVRINGEPIPPLDLSDARADISVYLKEGANTVDAIIATTLYNALYPIYGQLRSGDIPPYIGPNTLPTGFPTSLDSGLVGNVTLTLYNLVEIAG